MYETMLLKVFVFLSFLSLTYADLCDDLAADALNSTSPECLSQLEVMCKDGALLWKMIDASSKYPITGMLYSSNMDFGNFDECMTIDYQRENNSHLYGKFCTFGIYVINPYLDVIPNPFSATIAPKNLANHPQENFITNNVSLRNQITDAAFATGLSICIPDKCTLREVGKFFVWGSLEESHLVGFSDAVPCITKNSFTEFDGGEIAFICFLAFIGLTIVGSTSYDFILRKTGEKPYHPVLMSFSIITNGEKILKITSGPDQIGCLNGLRFISMVWIIAGHGFVAMKEVPVINYATVWDYQDKMGQQYIASAPIAVDTFFFLSGFLLCFGYLKSAAKLPIPKQILGIPMMVLHRYLRLTPAVAVLFFSSITIFKKLGLGPLWGLINHSLVEQCENHWWQFFLYVQNYTDFKDMCLNHTWYLSADMQMFLLAPLVLIPVSLAIKRNRPKLALLGMFVLTVICVIFPMLIRYIDHTIENVYDSHSRFGDYLIGMMLGLILRHPEFKRFRFGKYSNLIIWCFVLNSCWAFNLYYHNILRIYDHTSDTTFYGLYRPTWCLSLAWMVYSCYHGHGGIINWMLSLPVFQIGGRLSYCMYLLHAVIQMYWVGLIRTQYYWGDYMIFYTFCGHLIVTLIMSAVWTLAFESPMIGIAKFLLEGRASSKKTVKK